MPVNVVVNGVTYVVPVQGDNYQWATGQNSTPGLTALFQALATYSLPTQTASSGKFLTTNGTAASWTTNPGLSALTGDVTATGPGSAAATVAFVGGSAASLVHSAELLANAATSNPTVSATVRRDTNGNFRVNNAVEGYTTTTTAAGTTVLTAGSTRTQRFTGATTQIVTLPNATTLVLGHQFLIINRSTGTVTVNNNSGTLVLDVTSGSSVLFTATSVVSTAGAWDGSLQTGVQSAGSATANRLAVWTDTNTIGDSPGGAPLYVNGYSLGLGEAPPTTNTGLWAVIGSASSAIGDTPQATFRTSQIASASGFRGAINFGGSKGGTGATAFLDFASLGAVKENSTDLNTAGALAFGTRPAAGSITERMRLTSIGSLLLGATADDSSGALLQVTGTAKATTFVGALTGNVTGNASGSAGSFTGSLVGDVTGTQGATVVSFVATSSAANVHAAELLANAATNANTVSTIVKRDGSGNFSAGTITASLTGNASGSAGSFTGSLVGDVTGTQGATVVSFVAASSAANVHAAELLANGAVSAATASKIVLRDANANTRVNNLIENFATTATAAGTTTLAVGDAYNQVFTGSTTQTVVLPDATTLVVGHSFRIVNRSSATVTVNKNGGTLVLAVTAGSEAIFTVTVIGTSAGSWDAGLPATGSGVTTMAAVGSSPSANGASISGTTLTLQPADATHPGMIANGAQDIPGAKNFTTTSTTASGAYFGINGAAGNSTTPLAVTGAIVSNVSNAATYGLSVSNGSDSTWTVVPQASGQCRMKTDSAGRWMSFADGAGSSDVMAVRGGHVLMGSTTDNTHDMLQVTGSSAFTGKVGIGTTNPGDLLDVYGAPSTDGSLSAMALFANNSTAFGSSPAAGIDFATRCDGTAAIQGLAGIAGGKETSVSGNTNGYLAFYTHQHGGSMTEVGRFASTGVLTASGNVVSTNGDFKPSSSGNGLLDSAGTRILSGSGGTTTLKGGAADGAGATSVTITSANTFSNATARIYNVRNGGGTEVLAVDLNGKSMYPGGSAAVTGTATLSGGTVTVSTTAVGASSKVFLTHAGSALTNAGHLSQGTIVAATSFVINSSNASDTDTVNWWVLN